MKNKSEWELGRKVSYFNGSLKKLRLEKGLTQKQLADAVGLSTHMVHRYEVMRNIPTEKTAKKIAEFLGVNVEKIFPEYLNMLREQIPKNEIKYAHLSTKALEDYSERMLLLQAENSNPENVMMNGDIHKKLTDAFHKLSDREQKILYMYFGLDNTRTHTCEEIGAEFALSAGRVQQIKEKALRKIRQMGEIAEIKMMRL